jgi:ribosomal protein S12 methylthiotransferase accessory factor
LPIGSDRAAPWREHLLAIDLVTGGARLHAARRYRACPVCGEGAREPLAIASVLLTSRDVVFSADGGWRSAEPASVRERLAAFVSPLTGWVHDLEPRPLAPELASHVAVATYPYPVPSERFEDLGRRPRIAAAGKGLTYAQAQVGALAEAIERICGVFRGDEPWRFARQEDLGEEAIEPNSVQLFSARQLTAVERDGDGRHAPVAVFEPSDPIGWSSLWSLSAGRWRFVPTTLCYHAYRGPGPRCPADSNGCAAGSNREEAILQGLLELIERDHVAIWWHHRLPRPPYAVSRRLAPKLESAMGAHAQAGRELALLDLAADLDVPVAAAVSRPSADGDVLLGFGAHLDPDLAASRALAELHQFWPDSGGASRGWEARSDRASRRGRGLSAQPWLAAFPSAPRASMLSGPSCTDLRDAIEDLVARLAERGIEVLVLDQTRDGSPLAVVRVVAPGLRPWWRRLAPGRLYDVPLALGWLAAPSSEEDLNPDPLEA